jgi:hypothetical protein
MALLLWREGASDNRILRPTTGYYALRVTRGSRASCHSFATAAGKNGQLSTGTDRNRESPIAPEKKSGLTVTYGAFLKHIYEASCDR